MVAMALAGPANVSIMVFSAQLPAGAADSLPLAYEQFTQVAGRVAGVLFALALLASGLASTVVGIYTGQIVMQGFLHRSVSLGCAGWWSAFRRWFCSGSGSTRPRRWC